MDTGIFIGDKIITTSWDKIWNKPNTLSGYGITDAYTKSDADSRYRQLNTSQFYGDEVSSYYWINRASDGGGGWAYSPIRMYKGDKASQILNIGAQGLDSNTAFVFIGSQDYGNRNNLRIYPDGDVFIGSSLRAVSPVSDAQWQFGYSNTSFSGIVMHDISDANNAKALYIQTNGYDAPGDTGGLAITNDCVTVFGAGDRGSVFRVLNEDDVNLGALFNVAKDGTLTRLGNKIWDAGNDGSGSGLDADLLDGKHLGNVGDRVMRQIGFPHYDEFGSTDTNVYLRKVLGWCYNNVNTGASDTLFVGVGQPNSLGNMQIQLYCTYEMNSDGYPRYSSGVYFPLDGLPIIFGTIDYNYYQHTLAATDGNVYSATKLQTPRTIFSKPFDGTSNVTGGAKFNAICIETDNNGNDSGRSSEINNYVGPLQLQQASPNGIHMCMGGGQVGICTTSPKYTLHVDGVIYAKDGFRETSDIRKKKVLTSHTVSLDDMAYADLFDYTLIDDEKEIVRVGTNAHYWLDKLPQVVTKDNDEYLSLNYGVLGTVCALSVSKYVKQLEDRVTLLENKIASLQ